MRMPRSYRSNCQSFARWKDSKSASRPCFRACEWSICPVSPQDSARSKTTNSTCSTYQQKRAARASRQLCSLMPRPGSRKAVSRSPGSPAPSETIEPRGSMRSAGGTVSGPTSDSWKRRMETFHSRSGATRSACGDWVPVKAIHYTEYGSPDVLRLVDVPRPSPEDGEVLIQVRAAAANPLDWRLMRGSPYGIRIMTGLRKPRDARLGVDVAGRVEAVGANATEFRPGDEVFGSCNGAFAEYACGPEKSLVRKPDGMTFEQAATVGVAGVTALQGLRDRGRLQDRKSVV